MKYLIVMFILTGCTQMRAPVHVHVYHAPVVQPPLDVQPETLYQ